MNALRATPTNAFANMWLALIPGALIGSLAYAVVENQLYGADLSGMSAFDVLSLTFIAVIAGGCLLLVYALPVFLLLRRFGYVGPLVAFAVGAFPGVAALAVGGVKVSAALLPYGVAVAAVFSLLAYRRGV